VEIRQRIAVILCLGIGLASSGLTVAQSSPGLGQEMSHADREPPGLHDFDFLFGRWQIHHRKLKHRLVNSHEWIEFEGTLFCQPLMGGYANVDDTVFEVPGGSYRGVALRIVRRQDGAVVDLVDGQQDATWSDGSAGERQLPQWRRNVLCERRYRRRETSPHTAHMVRDHTHLRSLGAGRINRRW
jgi:hypothetical protein